MDSIHLSNYDFDRLDTDDLDVFELVAKEEGWNCKYQQLSAGAYHGQASAAVYNETLLYKEQHNQKVSVSGDGPAEDYVLGVSLDAPATYRFQGKQPQASDMLMIRPGATFDYIFNPNSELVNIQLSPQQLQSITMSAGIELDKLDQDIFPTEPPTMKRLQDWLRLATEPFTGAGPEPLQAWSMSMEQHLMEAIVEVLATWNGSKASPDRHQSPNLKSMLARQVRERFENSLEEPLKMIDLCGEMGCRLRTLQLAFTNYFGVPPGTYHKRMRMNAARCALQHADRETTTVTCIATEYGFWHLGWFAHDYKELFSESPSQTLASTHPPVNYASHRHEAI